MMIRKSKWKDGGPMKKDNEMTVMYELKGRIDSNNAADLEKDIFTALSEYDMDSDIIIDGASLEYISSAGLRVLLKCSKKWNKVSVIDVSPEIYEIFDVTGFTSIIDVHKKIREVSVEGLELLGKGANGSVYRLDDERIIKVYNPVTSSLERIAREKAAARQAFIHDIPSAISFDLVRSGDRYGIIYEMINASTLGQFITAHPDKIEEYAVKMADLLKKLHSTAFEDGVLPDARMGLGVWVDIAERSGYYSDELITKMRELIDDIPERNTFIHGDFHPGNIMVVDGELVLIDMTDASVGDPVIDLLGSYQIMKLLSMKRPEGGMRYTGIRNELLSKLWDIFIRSYTGITDEKEIEEYEKKLEHYALIRSIAGITFSELVPKEALPQMTKVITEAFLSY